MGYIHADRTAYLFEMSAVHVFPAEKKFVNHFGNNHNHSANLKQRSTTVKKIKKTFIRYTSTSQ